MNKGLLALGLGGIGIGITEFSMMGMLEDVAKDLQITIPEAGHLISTYAIGVVVGAPILVLFSAKFPPKKLLIFLMGMFTVFNSLSSIVPNYDMFLMSRFLSGLPHGAFFGVGTIVAARLAAKGKEAQSIAVMFAGLTIANLAGVPLATYIGHHFSWRYTYLLIAAIGILTMLLIQFWVPRFQAEKDTTIRTQLNYFKSPQSWLLILLISIGTGGLFAWISYIAPMMTKVAGFSETSIPNFMILAGLGMFIGNFAGGKLADSVSPARAAHYIFLSMAVTLLVVYLTVPVKFMAVLMTFITGVVAFSIGSSIQMMLIQSARGAEMIAAATGQASFNIGNAIGAYTGGLPIAWGYGFRSPQLVGVFLALLGAILTYVYIKKYIRPSASNP